MDNLLYHINVQISIKKKPVRLIIQPAPAYIPINFLTSSLNFQTICHIKQLPYHRPYYFIQIIFYNIPLAASIFACLLFCMWTGKISVGNSITRICLITHCPSTDTALNFPVKRICLWNSILRFTNLTKDFLCFQELLFSNYSRMPTFHDP